jgi:hypothetical protein
MITGLNKVLRGHYSAPFNAGALPQSAVSNLSKATITGETMADAFIFNTGAPSDPRGFTSDRMEITGLYITNAEEEAFTLSLQFAYGQSWAFTSVIPPLSTTYMITADDPIPWYGGGWTATLTGRNGQGIGQGTVAVHLNYQAIPVD